MKCFQFSIGLNPTIEPLNKRAKDSQVQSGRLCDMAAYCGESATCKAAQETQQVLEGISGFLLGNSMALPALGL